MSDPATVPVVSQESFVPSAIMGWTIEEDRAFDAETIFEYLDGAGEVYLSYNMKSVFARRFRKEGSPGLVVDLFDMGTSEDAFGVFTHDLDGEDAGFGQGSTYKGGLLSFWKDRYFASVYAEEETRETKQALRGLAGSIDAAIGTKGAKPGLLACLPAEGLEERSARFFHNYSVLNYHFFLADENILRLDQKTLVVLGFYGSRPARSVLLVVRYPEPGNAVEAYESFRRAMIRGGGDAAVSGDGTWTAVRRNGPLVLAVLKAPTRTFAEDQLRKAEAAAKGIVSTRSMVEGNINQEGDR
ncbi:MAG: DUF6599 family protein [Candidatus Aminicenantales bacterium]